MKIPNLISNCLELNYSKNVSALDDIIDLVKTYNIDGIIATNTSVNRDNLKSELDLKNQKGGLSGERIFSLSNNIIRLFHNYIIAYQIFYARC